MTDEELQEMLEGASQNRNANNQISVSDQAFKQMLSKNTNNQWFALKSLKILESTILKEKVSTKM